jgi:low temperature requirement protein LtrA
MVAGIILVALGLKTAIGHVDDTLTAVPAFALLGGISAYLVGLAGFRFRHIRSYNQRRMATAVLVFALLPVATHVPALATLAIVSALLAAVIAYDTRSYGSGRDRVRHEDFAPELRATSR